MCIRDLTNNATGIVHIPWSRIFQVGTPGELHRLKVQTSSWGEDDNNRIFAGMFRLRALLVLSCPGLSESFHLTDPLGAGCLKLSSIEIT